MKKIFLLLLFILVIPKISYGQVEKYKAVFTLNFIRYIGWTDEAKQGDFVIGVLKNHKVAEWLSTQSGGKKFGYQKVVVKEFNSVNEVEDCQVLYVSSSINFAKYSDALFRILGKSSFVITEAEGATKHGSVINFVIRNNNLKFEIAEANIKSTGLSISSKLSNMAAAIKK